MASSFRLRRATSSSLKSITDRVRRSTIQPVLISDQCRNGSQIYSPYFSSFVSSSTANLQPATGYFQNRCFRSSSVNLSSSKMFNDKEEITPDTILFEGCDYNHWLITMDFPKDPKPTDEEMVETYVQTCAKGLNISVEEAKKKMYACSTTTYNGFQALMTEEESKKFEGLPGVVFVLPDSYIDPVNKEYGGDKYIDGVIIRRPPPVQYGRSGGRYGDRNRNFDRPRYDRQGGQSFDQRGSPQGDGGSYGPPRQHNFGQSFQQSHSPPQQSPVPPPPQQNYSSPSQQNYGPSSYQNYGPPPSQSYPQPPPNNYAPPPPNNYTPPPPNNYAPSPPQNFGAPPPQNFNPPPQQNFSATPQQNFGATPQPNFSATPQQNFGSPPQQFGSPPQPFGSPNQPNFGSPPPQNFSPTPQQNFSPTPQQNFSPSGQGFGAPPQQNYTTPGQNYGTPSGQGFASSQQNYSPPRDFSSNQSYGQAQNYGASQSSRPPPQQSYSQRNYDFPHQSYGPSQQNYAPQRQRPPQSYEQSSRNYDPLIQRGRNEPIFGNTDAADGVGSSSSVVGSSAHPNPLDSQQNQSTNPPQNSNGVSGQGLSDNEALNLKEVQG